MQTSVPMIESSFEKTLAIIVDFTIAVRNARKPEAQPEEREPEAQPEEYVDARITMLEIRAGKVKFDSGSSKSYEADKVQF